MSTPSDRIDEAERARIDTTRAALAVHIDEIVAIAKASPDPITVLLEVVDILDAARIDCGAVRERETRKP